MGMKHNISKMRVYKIITLSLVRVHFGFNLIKNIYEMIKDRYVEK